MSNEINIHCRFEPRVSGGRCSLYIDPDTKQVCTRGHANAGVPLGLLTGQLVRLGGDWDVGDVDQAPRWDHYAEHLPTWVESHLATIKKVIEGYQGGVWTADAKSAVLGLKEDFQCWLDCQDEQIDWGDEEETTDP